ncbi:hypothetical protein IWW38_005127 [Coemansia aciculifera]|uniref:Uncharacterized protein n=1 Tax=Coemansia aciculifera TaxID=417176 RepID=A0ACC1LWS6_9FUNG|nr:hypothetical protein IWW38_005127 [Coemansia aciculifera]
MAIVTIYVQFPARRPCQDCDDYEEFRLINTKTTTVGQLKTLIATRLGVSSDEFIFEPTFPKATQDAITVDEAFITPLTEARVGNGLYRPGEWLMLSLYANPEFKGVSPLRCVLEMEPPRYCGIYDECGDGQLAKRLGESMVEFNRKKLE